MGKIRGAVKKLLVSPLQHFIYGAGIGAFRTDAASHTLSFEYCFQSLLELGIPVGTVIDVGASNGSWSKKAISFFPNARFLLIEANSIHEDALRRFCTFSQYDYVLAAAGAAPGMVYFDGSDPLGGQARNERCNESDTCITATSIDHEVETHGLCGPYCIKLDTHGFELPILEGARKTLDDASVVIIESYAFKLSPDCLLFHEMCGHMHSLGFSVFDLVSPMWRVKDNALWQVDIVFLRSEHSLFKDTSYE